MVRATMDGLKSLRNRETIAAARGKTVQEVVK
jgi:ribosomal protein S5